jgi:hypothetical protein
MKLVQILLFAIFISSFGSAAASFLHRLGQKTMYPFRVTKQKIVHGAQCISNKYKKICAVTLPTLLCWQTFGSGTAPAYLACKEKEKLQKEVDTLQKEVDTEDEKLKSSPYYHSSDTLHQKRQAKLTEETEEKLKPVKKKLQKVKEELQKAKEELTHLEHTRQPLTVRVGAHLGYLLHKNDVFNNLFKGTKSQKNTSVKKEPQAIPKTNTFPPPTKPSSTNSQKSVTQKFFKLCGIEQVPDETTIEAPEPTKPKKFLGIF